MKKTKKTISILGCGWLGLPLSKRLCELNYKVNGSNTSDKNFKNLTSIGAVPYVINLSNLNNSEEFLDADVLIVVITSKSISEFKNLISEIKKSTIKKVLFVSSTSGYPFINGIVTERTPTTNKPLAEIEQLFISNSSFKTCVLRFGGLFGPNRKPGNFIKSETQLNNPNGIVNLIHQDDCIGIIENIIEKNIWNETFNACADSHPTRKEFYTKKMLELGKEKPIFKKSTIEKYKIINSDKLKSRLNYEFKHFDLMK